MTKFICRLRALLKERGCTLADLPSGCGVARETPYRGIKQRSTLAALAYFLNMDVEEMVKGTDVEELWESGIYED